MLVFMVPTFRRPVSLLLTLDAIKQVEGFQSSGCRIVVVDNDYPVFEGLKAARSWVADNRMEGVVDFVEAPERGLSHCRNAGLQHCFQDQSVDAVLMVDDDSCPLPGVLDAYVSAMGSSDADIYGGPTVYTFSGLVDDRVKTSGVFGVPFRVSGFVDRLRSSNNCLVRRRVLEKFETELFDIRFNRSGGEDTNFFSRARALGLRFYWVAEAQVVEPVPELRATCSWVLKRHRMSAINAARDDILVLGALRGGVRQCSFVVKEFLSCLMRLFFPSKSSLWLARLRFEGAKGRLEGLFYKSGEHVV